MRKAISTALALFIVSSVIHAEVSSRECWTWVPGKRVVVPASTTVDLATMQFHLLSGSDAVFNAAVFYQDSSTIPDSRVRYLLSVDGGLYHLGTATQYFMRTPLNTDGTVHLRDFFQGIPAGDHVATLKVVNVSTSPVQILGTWITPLFVDASEAGVTDQRVFTQTVAATSWTTIGTLTVPPIADRSIYLSGYARGSAAGDVTFRISSGGVTLEKFTMNFRNREDGGIFNFFYKNPNPGTQVLFEAQGTASLVSTEFSGQTLQRYTILSGLSTAGTTTPNDFNAHTLVATLDTLLNSLSTSGPTVNGNPNQFATCSWGHGYAQMQMSASTEASLQMYLFENGSMFPFDIGVDGHSPDATRNIYRDQNDWGCGVGLFNNKNYHVELELQGLCTGGPSISTDRAQVQVVVLPAPNPYNHTCTTSHDPNCPYACNINPLLTQVTEPARLLCNP